VIDFSIAVEDGMRVEFDGGDVVDVGELVTIKVEGRVA
jgi:hypothetical protein